MTDQPRDQIETRAAHLYEYGTLTDGPLQADLDQLTGTDVPAMAAEIRRLRAELATARERIADEVIEWSGQQIGVHVPTIDAIADMLRAAQPAASRP